jgi:hypothetical protein
MVAGSTSFRNAITGWHCAMCKALIYPIALASCCLGLTQGLLPAQNTLNPPGPPLPSNPAPWEAALAQMQLDPPVRELNRTNCVDVMLRSFQSNGLVKALIFLPGATDELYFFHRARARLSATTPTLLDGVRALTNQTLIRLSYRPPLLLLHTEEDPIDPILTVEDAATAERVKQTRFVRHAIYNDRDWGVLEPILKQRLKVAMRPWRYSKDAWHFYRHSFAAWNLTGWEALEATALAGKTTVSIQHKSVVFSPDRRVRTVPKLDAFPR